MSLFKVRSKSFIFGVTLFVLWVIIIAEWKYIEILKENNEMKMPQVFPRGSELQSKPKVEPFLAQRDVKVERNRSLNVPLDYSILKDRKRKERILEKSIRDFWWYARASIRKTGGKNSDIVIKNMAHRYSSIKWRYDEFMSTDDLWKTQQLNISQELTSLMEKRLHKLQNPENCKTARKLVCHVAKACGFGCQIHHVSYCFILAYAAQRTLILDSSNWKYSPQGWNVVFKPISSTCTEIPSGTVQMRVCDFYIIN